MTAVAAQTALDPAALDGLVLRTPCVALPQPNGTTVWAKLEFLQPSGSTKDRFAALVLRRAIAAGTVGAATTVVEASSGSTSIAFAMACARLSLPFVAVVPENVSNERTMIIRRYGGRVVLTNAADGVGGAVAEAEARATTMADAFLPRQFTNPLNALAHELGTGAELVEQVPGRVDAFVAGVGTGGTLAGAVRALAGAHPDVVPAEARPVDADGRCPAAGIPGIVSGMSGLLEGSEPARTIPVTEQEAVDAARRLCARGLAVGLSSGLNMAAACVLAAELPAGGNVVTVLPDRMERYFSGALFADLVMA